MNKEVKNCLKASVGWFGVFVIMLIDSMLCDLAGIDALDGFFAFVGMFSLFVSPLCLIYAVVEFLKSKTVGTKNRYRKSDNKDFLEKANGIEQKYNDDIQHCQELINADTKDKEELVSTLKIKEDGKRLVDSSINKFIKENTIKIGRGLTVNMIDNTIEYYTTTIRMEDITGVQVQCNSKVVTESNTVEQRKARKGLVSTVGRATVGVALTGGMPVGAVLGLTGTKKTKGSSNTTTTQQEINTYTVVVLTSSIKNSVVTIACGNSEVEAISISNSINNACLNMGTLDTEEHEANVAMSTELGKEIQELKDKINAINKDIKGLDKSIKDLNKLCNKQIKELRKELKKDGK